MKKLIALAAAIAAAGLMLQTYGWPTTFNGRTTTDLGELSVVENESFTLYWFGGSNLPREQVFTITVPSNTLMDVELDCSAEDAIMCVEATPYDLGFSGVAVTLPTTGYSKFGSVQTGATAANIRIGVYFVPSPLPPSSVEYSSIKAKLKLTEKPIPILSYIRIFGDSSVDSGGSCTYECQAYLTNVGAQWKASPKWSIVSGGEYATIDSSGTLKAKSTTVERSVTVKATFTWNGVTKTATTDVKIRPPMLYYVFFHANGGTGGKSFMIPKGTKLDSYMKELSPKCDGCTFNGWWTDKTGGTRVSPSAVVTADRTCYAHWSNCVLSEGPGNAPWTQQYDGIWKSGAIADKQASSLGASVSGAGAISFKWKASSEKDHDVLTFCIYEDLNFAGEISGISADWENFSMFIGGEGTHTLLWIYSKDGSKKAGSDFCWVKDVEWKSMGTPCAIAFAANGGTGGKTFSSVGVGRTLGYYMKQLSPKRDGYVFNGWWTAKSGGKQVTADDVASGDATYYAHWTVPTCSVFFHANGGTGGKTFTVAGGAKLGTYMDKVTPKRDGCTFNGWWTAKTGGTQVKATDVATGDATYYAHWIVPSYSIFFHANGGTGGKTFTVAGGAKLGTYMDKVSPKRDGCTFNGWWTAKSGGTQVKATDVATGDATYYAHWSAL